MRRCWGRRSAPSSAATFGRQAWRCRGASGFPPYGRCIRTEICFRRRVCPGGDSDGSWRWPRDPEGTGMRRSVRRRPSTARSGRRSLRHADRLPSDGISASVAPEMPCERFGANSSSASHSLVSSDSIFPGVGGRLVEEEGSDMACLVKMNFGDRSENGWTRDVS